MHMIPGGRGPRLAGAGVLCASPEEVLAERTIARLRLTALAGMIPFLLIAGVDVFTTQKVWPLLPIRLAAVVVLFGGWYLAGRPFGRRHPAIVGAVPCLAIAAEIATVIHFGGGAESPFFATMAMMLLAAGFFLALPPHVYAGIALASSAIYIVPIALGDTVTDTHRFVVQCTIVVGSAGVGTLGALLVWRLETREIAARAALEAANRELQAIDRAKTEFFQNISHELRTPLTLNLAPLEALARGEGGKLSAEQARLVNLVRSNALRLRDLVNDLLRIAEIDAGRYRPDRRPTLVAELVGRIADRFAVAFEAKRVKFRVDPGPGSLRAMLDPEAFTKVLSNLLANALKYTDVGEVLLEVSERRGEIEIAVADTGVGMSDEARRHLFERFAPSARRDGTGIGLALTKELVEAEGGRIFCESRIGSGTTFRVVLPLRPASPDLDADSPGDASGTLSRREILAATGVGSDAHVLDAARRGEVGRGPQAVLIVEDAPDLAELLILLLQRRHRVRWAADGVEGLARAKEMRPDLIIADVAMPRMDGLALCRAIKEDAALTDVPVLLLTARVEAADHVRGYEAGAVDYVTKPFEASVLESKVLALLKIRILQQALVARERLAAVGEVTITLAHEVNNALAGIVGFGQLLDMDPGLSADARASVREILDAATRIRTTVEKLRGLKDARATPYLGETKMLALE